MGFLDCRITELASYWRCLLASCLVTGIICSLVICSSANVGYLLKWVICSNGLSANMGYLLKWVICSNGLSAHLGYLFTGLPAHLSLAARLECLFTGVVYSLMLSSNWSCLLLTIFAPRRFLLSAQPLVPTDRAYWRWPRIKAQHSRILRDQVYVSSRRH